MVNLQYFEEPPVFFEGLLSLTVGKWPHCWAFGYALTESISPFLNSKAYRSLGARDHLTLEGPTGIRYLQFNETDSQSG